MPKKKKSAKKSSKKTTKNKSVNKQQDYVKWGVVGIVALAVVFLLISSLNPSDNETINTPKTFESYRVDTSQQIERWEHSALRDAIKFEYRADEIYSEVIAKEGNVDSFVDAQKEKEAHIDVLKQAFIDYELDIPVNIWENRIILGNTLEEHCTQARQAEQQLVSLYERQLIVNEENPSLIKIFTKLKSDAEERVLDFQACE